MPEKLLGAITLETLNSGRYDTLFPNCRVGLVSDLMKTNYTAFIEGIYTNLDRIKNRMEFHPHSREHDTEDRTTIEIVNSLRLLSVNAEHDSSYNGNCDIVVNNNDQYLWLAEAKIDYNMTHIMEGFRQLVDRYAPSSQISKEGCLLIYCKSESVTSVITNWKNYLTSKDQKSDEYSVNIESVGDRFFFTTHMHKSSSQIFKVKHVAVSLFDTASDKSAKDRKDCNHTCEKCCKAIKPQKTKTSKKLKK